MTARILVVDDILPNVKLLEAKLLQEYFEVITAMSGEEALEKIQNEKPDIVLLDVMMPGMDGFEVCDRIKQDPYTEHIPVVMVTALSDTADRVKGLEVGADDFLVKPVNDVALMARVKSLIRIKMMNDELRARQNTAATLGVLGEDQKNQHNRDVQNANILYIDDQNIDLAKISNAADSKNHKITYCPDGKEAIERASIISPELIIISIDLENEDSLRLCSQFRSSEKTRHIPILMVANNEDNMPRIAKGLEIGATDYIIRPIDTNELLARMQTQIKRKRVHDDLKTNYETSLSMALKDPLTGLFNRRYIDVHLETLLSQTGDLRKNVAILMMDIDHFKAVNDTHGHNVGDEILKIFAERISSRMRGFDLLARTGGEEFVVALVDVSLEKACFVAERLRKAIDHKAFPVSSDAKSLDITVSIGGAYIGKDVYKIEDALERSDKQLYVAKESGRNCVSFEDIGPLDKEKYKEESRSSY
jgi:two-component system cell cycle response regulator